MFGLTAILICVLLAILVCPLLGIFCYSLYINSFWKRNKVPFVPAKPIAGNLLDTLLFRKCLGDTLTDIYNDEKTIDKPFVGMHIFHKPVLMIKDPELIKRILVKDFPSFCDRYTQADMHSDILGSSNLFFMRNPAWRILRSRLTSFFTSGKLKNMFYLMKNIGNEMNDTMLSFKLNKESNSFVIEIKDLVGRYTTDVTSSCVFGIETNSLKNPACDFIKSFKNVFELTFSRTAELLCIFLLPEFVPYFKCKFYSKKATAFLRNAIGEIISEREKTGATRNDLIDTLITLKNEDKSNHSSVTDVVFKGDVIVAQAAIFIVAGYESSATVSSFAIYELAFHPDVQTKLREEIKNTLLTSNGELTYDNVKDMAYLHMILQETLRMYSPLSFLDRKCTNSEGYSLEPYDNFVISHNMPVYIPICAIHRDPKYWTKPNKFDPERFSAENQDKIVPYTFLPMGTGPHNCIGERFGLMQSKIGLINFFRNHYVTPTENTPRVVKIDPKAFALQAKGGIVLNVVRDPLV